MAENQKVWKKLWSVNLPDRVKLLTWRVIHNAIPVANNLRRRGCGEQSEGCCFCGFKNESVDHIFINCWWARAFWSGLEVQRDHETSEEKVADWLWCIMKEETVRTLETIMVGIWILWKNRNLMTHKSKRWTIDVCKRKVHHYLNMFRKRVILGGTTSEDPYKISQDKWTIVCDGAWDGRTGRGGYAAVAMKENLIFACRAGWIERCESAVEAETRGILEGIAMVGHLNLQAADIVSDSVKAIWAIQNGYWEQGSETRVLISDVKRSCGNLMWSLRHVFRDLTVEADALAKYAKRMKWTWNATDAVPMEIARARSDGGRRLE